MSFGSRGNLFVAGRSVEQAGVWSVRIASARLLTNHHFLKKKENPESDLDIGLIVSYGLV